MAGDGRAVLDVAVSGLGPVRRDPEGDQPARPGGGHGPRHHLDEGSGALDGMVGREHQQQVVGRGQQRRGGCRGGRVAPHRLQHRSETVHTDFGQLVRNGPVVVPAAHDDRIRRLREESGAQDGFLQHRTVTGRAGERFGMLGA